MVKKRYYELEKMERELYIEAKKRNDKEKKFETLSNIINYNNNGARARQLVNIVAKEYENKPQELKKYFSDSTTLINVKGEYIDSTVDGIARSAYIMLTQDFSVLKDSEFAGFGITLNTSPKKLVTSNAQFKYAKLKGDALQNSINKDYSLQYSVNFDKSLKGSRNYDNTLLFAVNFDEALESSRNYDNTLLFAVNFDEALENSRNYDNTLFISENREDSLQRSRNYDSALNFSKNFENALQKSRNHGETLINSKNFNNAGMYSRNRSSVGKMAETYHKAFTNATIKKDSFSLGRCHGEFEGGQFTFTKIIKKYNEVKKIQQERRIFLERLN